MTSGASWVEECMEYSHPLGAKNKKFIMLRAYIDDSGSHDEAPHCLLAGYWGWKKDWKKFESAWNEVLAEYGVSEFHANTFWPRINGKRLGEFKDWDDATHKLH